MLTAGVDLAAEPKGTALAVIEWTAAVAKVIELRTGVTDFEITAAAAKVDKLGIDCAFGWPIEFVDFLVANARADSPGAPFEGGSDLRRRLAHRETDRNVREITGKWPLSVSTDRLGMTAIRCAGLLSQISSSGIEVDRAGAGKLAEIYPGASLRLWGFDTAGYRASNDVRRELLNSVKLAATWLELGDNEQLMIESCDAFDAVIAALAARSVAIGSYHKPEPHQMAQAKIEGWVTLPNVALAALI